MYEDDNIVVINKPVGIESCRIPCDATLCHRLDRNTSGLVLFAKNKESLEILLEKFKNQEIEKHYLCKVYGIPKKEKDTLIRLFI